MSDRATEPPAGESDPGADRAEREARLAEILAGYMDLLARGEKPDGSRILAENPDLARDLEEALGASVEVRSHLGEAPLGDRLGKYRILREVGRGGMGIVYEAWEATLERRVALKALPAAFSADPKVVQRFRREARFLAKLHHKNIVPVFDSGVLTGTLYYTMEFVDGATLDHLQRSLRPGAAQDPPPPVLPVVPAVPADAGDPDRVFARRLAEAFAGAAEGFHHAHRQGILHRDVKPSNLILDAEGCLHILDFGLARLDGQEGLTLTGDFLGTPLYMSPEQAGPRRQALDARTDIYSLGATLYETLTGIPPFRGTDHRDTLNRILTREPRPPRKIRGWIPHDLETIVLKCLRKNPRDRYNTAEALAQDLRRFARGEPIEARSQHPLGVIVRRAWRRRALFASLASVLLLLAAAALLLAKFSGEASRDRKERFEKGVLRAVLRLQLAQPSREGEAAAVDPAREALRELAEAETLVSRSPEVHYHRARCLQVLERESEAIAELERALACDPSFVPAAILKTALVRNRDGMGERVEDVLAIRSSADPWAEAFRKAHEARLDGRWSEVVEALTLLIRIEREKGSEVYLGSSAETFLARGTARRMSGDLLGALEDFATACARWPGAVEPSLLLGEAYLLLGAPERGREIFEDLYRATAAPSRDALAVKIAFVYHERGDYTAGLAWTERIGRRELLATSRADYLRHLGRLEEALAAAKEARDLDPENPFVQANLGKVLAAGERLSEGVEAFEKAVKLDPDSALFHDNLALALERAGNLERAALEYRRALDLNPQFGHAHRGIAALLAMRDQVDSAIEEYRAAIRFDPRDAVARHNLGNIYCRRKMYREAVEQFEAAVRIHPTEPLSRLNLAFNLRMEGRSREAIDGFREALKLDPGLAKAHFFLGSLLEEEGESGDAIEEHCAALALDPGLDPAGAVLGERLESLRASGGAGFLKAGARASLGRAAGKLEASTRSEPILAEALDKVLAFRKLEELGARENVQNPPSPGR